MDKEAASSFMDRSHLVDFTGCIQDVEVNNEPVNVAANELYNSNLRPCFEGNTEPGLNFITLI